MHLIKERQLDLILNEYTRKESRAELVTFLEPWDVTTGSAVMSGIFYRHLGFFSALNLPLNFDFWIAILVSFLLYVSVNYLASGKIELFRFIVLVFGFALPEDKSKEESKSTIKKLILKQVEKFERIKTNEFTKKSSFIQIREYRIDIKSPKPINLKAARLLWSFWLLSATFICFYIENNISASLISSNQNHSIRSLKEMEKFTTLKILTPNRFIGATRLEEVGSIKSRIERITFSELWTPKTIARVSISKTALLFFTDVKLRFLSKIYSNLPVSVSTIFEATRLTGFVLRRSIRNHDSILCQLHRITRKLRETGLFDEMLFRDLHFKAKFLRFNSDDLKEFDDFGGESDGLTNQHLLHLFFFLALIEFSAAVLFDAFSLAKKRLLSKCHKTN